MKTLVLFQVYIRPLNNLLLWPLLYHLYYVIIRQQYFRNRLFLQTMILALDCF